MKYLVVFLLLLIALGATVFYIHAIVKANYEYNNTIKSSWDLADKASTIAQKSDYIDQFVAKLEASGLQGTNNALYFPTPDNSFDKNLEAVKSLQSRLHSVKTMDENSFAYQTAIQQITAQEQGEADNMLSVFSGSWWKVHHYYLWNGWWTLTIVLGLIALWVGMIIAFVIAFDF